MLFMIEKLKKKKTPPKKPGGGGGREKKENESLSFNTAHSTQQIAKRRKGLLQTILKIQNRRVVNITEYERMKFIRSDRSPRMDIYLVPLHNTCRYPS